MEDSEITKKDNYGVDWPIDFICCPVCGQPDDCGDCNHKPYTKEEVKMIRGW